MSLSLNGTGQSLFGSNVAATVQKGADLEEIQTDVRLAFESTININMI
jgi:hypothetical protein